MSQDPYLPPGCTNAEIDRHMGGDEQECETCKGTGKVDISNCCGAEIQSEDICADCKEHCEKDSCGDCDGTGYVDMEKAKREAAEIRADMEYDRWKDEQMGL